MPQTDNKGKHNRPMSAEEEKQLIRTASIMIASAIILMGVLTLLVHLETIKLYPSTMNVDLVKGYAGRLEYAFRYQTLLVSWLVFNILATIGGRFKSKALNPLDETTEEKVQIHKNILTNSFEQILVSVIAQLIFVSFASPESVLKFIPLINIIQFIGRICFFVGYPMKRAFGFQCSILPNIVLVIYDLSKFVSFLFNF